MAIYKNSAGETFTNYQSFLNSMSQEEMKSYVQDMIDGKTNWPSKGNLKSLCLQTYDKLSSLDYDATEKMLDKISSKLSENSYVVSRIAENGKNGRPIVTNVKIKNPSKVDKKDKTEETKDETKDDNKDKETDTTNKEEEEAKKKEAEKKAAKERSKFWNTLSNAFAYASFVFVILAMCGFGLLAVTLATVLAVTSAVTKGIAYQGGFGLNKEKLDDMNAETSEEKLTKELAKDLELSKKQIKENQAYKDRLTSIENDDKEIDKIHEKLAKLKEQGLGSSKEAERLEKQLAKHLKHKQKLQDANQEFLDNASMTQLMALKGKASAESRFDFDDDEISKAMIRNAFKEGTIETTHKTIIATNSVIEKSQLSKSMRIALAEMTSDERAAFLGTLNEYSDKQIEIIQASQLHEKLTLKKQNVETYKKLTSKPEAERSEAEKKQIASLEAMFEKAGGQEKYFTAEDNAKLSKYSKVLLSAHGLDENGKITIEKRASIIKELRHEAELTRNKTLQFNLDILDKLKIKEPRTKEEQASLDAATAYIDGQVSQKLVEERKLCHAQSAKQSKRDTDRLRKVCILVEKTAGPLFTAEHARDQIIQINEAISLNPELTEEYINNRIGEIRVEKAELDEEKKTVSGRIKEVANKKVKNNDEIKALEKKIKSKDLKIEEIDVAKLTKENKELQAKINADKKKVKQTENKLEKLKKSKKPSKTEIDNLSKELETLNNNLKGYEKSFNENSEKITLANSYNEKQETKQILEAQQKANKAQKQEIEDNLKRLENEQKDLELTPDQISQLEEESKNDFKWENMTDSERQAKAKELQQNIDKLPKNSPERTKLERELKRFKNKYKYLFKEEIKELDESSEPVVESVDFSDKENKEYDDDSVYITKESTVKEKSEEDKKNKKKKNKKLDSTETRNK